MRPYDPALGAEICRLLAEGQSLREIASLPDMPARSTVYLWLSAVPAFADQYARAREAALFAIADDILEIADDSRNDYRDRQVRDGWVTREVDQEAIRRSQLRIDSRKWLLAKLMPKTYGDKLAVDHATPSGPLTFAWLPPDSAQPEPTDDE